MMLLAYNEMQHMECESLYDTICVQELNFAVVKTMNILPSQVSNSTKKTMISLCMTIEY